MNWTLYLWTLYGTASVAFALCILGARSRRKMARLEYYAREAFKSVEYAGESRPTWKGRAKTDEYLRLLVSVYGELDGDEKEHALNLAALWSMATKRMSRQ